MFPLPFEWPRSRRARLHNAWMKEKLLASESEGPFRSAPTAQRVVVDYRIEHDGRPVFFGVALVAVGAQGPEVHGFCLYRSVPLQGELDATTPYDLAERPARSW